MATKSGRKRNGGIGWWVTMATNDLDSFNALALAASLRSTLTTRKLCVLVGSGVSMEMRVLLAQAFEYAVDNPTDGLTGGNLTAEGWLTLSVWKCGFAETIVFLHPHSIVLKNCDELFALKEDFAMIPPGDNLQFTASVFVLRPHYRTFNDILAKLSTTTTETLVGAQEALNSYFRGNENGNVGSLGHEYNLVVANDNQVEIQLNSGTKIVHFSSGTPWKWQIPEPWKQFYQNVGTGLPGQLLDNLECKELLWHKRPNGQKQPDDGVEVCGDAIAIIGFNCRFPGANNEHEFWDLLLEGRDETRPLPPSRFFTKLHDLDQNLEGQDPPAGYLKCPIDQFDAKFFEISPRVAEYMDPQQRLLLEVTWEALEHAGLNPLELNGSNTAVFAGLWMQEYLEHTKQEQQKKSLGLEFQHQYLGNAVCVSSAQISHFLGLRGPSVAFEAGCASALAGFHYACEALKSRATDLAISCGVNIATAGLGGTLGEMHAKDGKCKTFDESADGFARAEACVSFVLKRMADAVRDENEILGIVRGSALNHSGAGSPLGTPNVETQTLVLQAALEAAGIQSTDVSYVEAHGTGTKVGDPVEFQALNQVFAGRNVPLVVGSVKTNIGHTEAASGLAGLVKVLLCLRHRVIPRHLHLKKLNSNINLDVIPVIIPQANTDWKPTSKHGLIAGVSSFGFSGTNVHVVLQEAPPPAALATKNLQGIERTNHLLALSAKSEQALRQLVDLYISLLESERKDLTLQDLCYSANTGRANFRHFRLAIVAKDTNQLLARLRKENHISKNVSKEKPKIVFLFTGQGSQYVAMAQALYTTHPVFKATFDRCARLLRVAHGLNLGEILGYTQPQSGMINLNVNDSIHSQPAIFCIEICLAELWASFGIAPDYVLGHSVGEFAAAVVAGVLTLEEGMGLVVGRSKLVSTIRPGAMLVVKASIETVKRLILDFHNNNGSKDVWVDIAAINSSSEVVLSGTCVAMDTFETFVKNNAVGLGTQRLAATHAFHSRDMDLIQGKYKQILKNSIKKSSKLKCRYISGTFGREMNLHDFNQNENEYWVRHLRDTVNFAKAFGQLVEISGTGTAFVEIGPQPILLSLGMTAASAPEAADPSSSCWCPSIRKAEDNWVTMLTSLSKLYMFGVDVDWSRFDAHFPRRRLPLLPTYPWQRERFWVKGVAQGELESVVVNAKKVHPLLGKRIPSPLVDTILYCNSISLDNFSYIRDHKVADQVILPAAGYLEIVLAAGRHAVLCAGDNANAQLQLTVEDLVMEAALPLAEEKPAKLQVVLNPQTTADNQQLHYNVRIYLQTAFDPQSGADSGRWKKLASANFLPCGAVGRHRDRSGAVNIEELKASLCERETVDDVYSKFMETGLNLGQTFKTMRRMWYSDTQLLVEIATEGAAAAVASADGYTCHPLLLDAMIQSCVAEFMRNKDGADKGLYLPIKIGKCVVMTGSNQNQTDNKFYVHYSHGDSDAKGLGLRATTSGTLLLYNQNGIPLATMEGVEFVQTTVPAFLRVLAAAAAAAGTDDGNEFPDFYEEIWQPALGPREARVRPSSDHSRLDECEEEAMKCMPAESRHYFDAQSGRMRQEKIDALCYWYILRALRTLGWNGCQGEKATIPAAVLPNHKQLLARWFHVLEEEGDLVSIGAEWRSKRPLPSLNEIEIKISELRSWFLGNCCDYDEVEHEFVTNCGEQLAEVLTGKISAHSVLFSGHSGCRAQLKRAAKGDGEVFRVLEVGAGTGSTTSYILAQLAASGVRYEYTFTDISPTLIKEARKQYSATGAVKCKVLDIELDPKTQGFSPHFYDCVVADNVLHATRSLSDTLTNLRHLLVPGGQFVFTEIVGNIRTIDISFGLLDSWWRFKDFDVRGANPVVPAATWFKLLRENRFVDPAEYNCVEGMDVRSFVAFAGAEDCTSAAKSANMWTWVLFGFHDDPVTRHLGQMLRQIGRNVVEVHGDPSATNLTSRASEGHLVYNLNPLNSRHFSDLCNQIQNVEGVLYLWGIQTNPELDAHLRRTSGGLLHLIQAFHAKSKAPKLVVVTRGAQHPSRGEEQEQRPEVNPISATLSGILISYLNEFPNNTGVTIDMDSKMDDAAAAAQDVFDSIWLNEREPQVAFQSGRKWVRRLVRCPPNKRSLVFPSAERYEVSIGNLEVHMSVGINQAVNEGQIEIKVVAATLNLGEDVAAMAGFSGAVVNSNGSKFKVGDRVFGQTTGNALASHVVVPSNSVHQIPEGMSYEEAAAGVAAGKFTRFPLSRIQDAMRFLQEVKGGKVVVVIRIPTISVHGARIEHKEELFNPYGTYLISGGLGGLGLEVAKWMASSGAKYIVLVGRNPPTPRAELILAELRAEGVHLLVEAADISDMGDCKRVLTRIKAPSTGFPPLKGVIQSAGALADNLLVNQDLAAFMEVYKAKVTGTWNLHSLTLHDYALEHFVLFSSMVGGLGGLGQANHSAANKYLDSFAKYRMAQGLPCCSINWAAWSEVGAAISKEGMLGFRSISPAQGVAALRRIMVSQQINTTVCNVGDLKMLTSTYNLGNYFTVLEAEAETNSNQGRHQRERERERQLELESLRGAADPVERESKIKEFIEAVVRDTLRLAETEPIDPEQNLREMGVDSMMAMEVRSKIQQLLAGFELISLNELQENLTVSKLARVVNGHMSASTRQSSAAAQEELIREDCILPEDIVPIQGPKGSKIGCVLLTGVTGHFGPYILEQLLESDPRLEVYCLIRAQTDQHAQERLDLVLDDLGLLLPRIRIHCIAGDVTMPQFRLDPALYGRLCNEVDAIMHCAAVVNLSLPYAGEIRNNNVLGLLNLLRFATTGSGKVLQFASSISAQVRLQNDGTMLDEFPEDAAGESLRTGYHLSKFVCERLLEQALARGIPVTVVRHNYLVGDCRNGLAPTWRNPLVAFLVACMRIGKFPQIGTVAHLSTVPVNTSAKIAVQLFLDLEAERGMYNVNNPKVRRFFDLVDVIKEKRGVEGLEMVSYDQWKDNLEEQGIQLNLDAKWLIETLLPCNEFDVFKNNVVIDTIKNGSTDACRRMWSNSPKLKKIVPNVDELMIDPIEMVKLQLNYYENTKA